MREAIPGKLPRLILTLLLALGLTFAVLNILNLPVRPLSCALLCAAASLALEAVFLTRRTALWGVPVLLLVLVIRLAGGGMDHLSDLLRAFALHFGGVPGALGLMEEDAARALALLLTLLSFLCARKGAGSAGALLLTAGAALLLWLLNQPALVPFLLPAAAASLCLLWLERRPELTLRAVLPWAGVLVLLAWLLTPRQGAVVPSLKDRADQLRQTVMDRLFFTEPRDVFSLSAEGFYPQGISQLGGPVTPSDHPVLQVSAPRTVYLRGVLMNEYDGRAWRNTLGGRRYLWDAPGMASRRSGLFDQELPSGGLSSALTEPAEVSVRMLGEGASTLFVPQRVRELRAGGELVPYFTNSSELFATRNLQAGDTWSVTAPLFRAGDPGLGTLVDAAARTEDPQWESVLETYTVLPSHLEEPVWQLASDIASGLSSPYEKAFAIQNYLSRNCRYRLDVDFQPANMDFVTAFLFGTREGYCTYFASALTVLCRMAGLPARYVEGYLAVPDARGEALVTGRDAHAWTEVYFRGFGWLTFDAVPVRGQSEGGTSGAPETTPPPPSPTPSPAPDAASPDPDADASSPTPPPDNPAGDPLSPEPPVTDNPPDGGSASGPENQAAARGGFPWLLWLLPLLLLFGVPALRWFLTSPARREKRLQDESDRFDLWLGDALSRLSAAGFDRPRGETVMNFARRLDAEGGLSVSLGQLGECASLLHYGRVSALETDTALARDTALALKKALPRKARLRYGLRRLSFRSRFHRNMI